MDKIFLANDQNDKRSCFMDKDTDQFYVVLNYVPKSRNIGPFAVGFFAIFGSTFTALGDTIDSFYVPRASVVSNLLLLAMAIGIAIFFRFWLGKKAKQGRETQIRKEFLPVFLEDKKKKELLKKSLGAGYMTLGLIVASLVSAIILVSLFLQTSRSVFYTWALFSMVLFIFLAQFRTDTSSRMKFVRQRLKAI